MVCSIRHFPTCAVPVRAAVPPSRLHGPATGMSSGRCRRYRSCAASCRRSPGWRVIGVGHCACWTSSTAADSDTVRAGAPAGRGYAASLGRRGELGGDGSAVLPPRRVGARHRIPLARARSPRLARDAGLRVARARRAHSATRRGSSPASTRCPPRTTTRSPGGSAGEDPMDAPFPMHPSYEERDGVPDRSFPRVSPEQARG